MHELGVLRAALKTVSQIAEKHNILRVRFVTLEVGTESSYVPTFFHKLYPIAVEHFPVLQQSKLNLLSVPGTGLTIKEIGY